MPPGEEQQPVHAGDHDRADDEEPAAAADDEPGAVGVRHVDPEEAGRLARGVLVREIAVREVPRGTEGGPVVRAGRSRPRDDADAVRARGHEGPGTRRRPRPRRGPRPTRTRSGPQRPRRGRRAKAASTTRAGTRRDREHRRDVVEVRRSERRDKRPEREPTRDTPRTRARAPPPPGRRGTRRARNAEAARRHPHRPEAHAPVRASAPARQLTATADGNLDTEIPAPCPE